MSRTKITRACENCNNSDVEYFIVNELILKSWDRRFQVQCKKCGTLGEKRKTLHGAVMAWNNKGGE